jgi:hypothetical protein
MLNLLKTLPPVYTYRTQKKAKISDFQDFHGGRLKAKVPNSKENSKPRWPRVMRSESKNAKRSVVVGKNIRASDCYRSFETLRYSSRISCLLPH